MTSPVTPAPSDPPFGATSEHLAQRILAFADDSLLLGHRNSEWSGHAPILEEDIAFSNLALDELGHAQLWYVLYQELTGADPDRVVFFRNVSDWRSSQFVELPKGDWAFSMMRQYLYDAYENVLLPLLTESRDARVVEIATKIRSEEIYHLRHTANWIKRLGLGTDESHVRSQRALDELWAYALQLFVPIEGENELITSAITTDPEALERAWRAAVVEHLTNSGLRIPAPPRILQPSRDRHTTYLSDLLADMQSVARSEESGVAW